MRTSTPIVLPGTDRARCPCCLENTLRLTPIVVEVGAGGPDRGSLHYSATCETCGSVISRHDERPVTFAEFVAAYVLADIEARAGVCPTR